MQVADKLCTSPVLMLLAENLVNEGVFEHLVPLCQPADPNLRAIAARALSLQATPSEATNLISAGLAGHLGKWLAEGPDKHNHHRYFADGSSAGSDMHQIARLMSILAVVKPGAYLLFKSGAVGHLLDLYARQDIHEKHVEEEMLSLLDATSKICGTLKTDSRIAMLSDKALTPERAKNLVSWVAEGSNEQRGYACWALMYVQWHPGVSKLCVEAGIVDALVKCINETLEDPEAKHHYPHIILPASSALCNALSAEEGVDSSVVADLSFARSP